MIGIIVTGIILFILLVLYYNISVNPNLLKRAKKSKPEVVKEKVDPDLQTSDINYKISKKEAKELKSKANDIQQNSNLDLDNSIEPYEKESDDSINELNKESDRDIFANSKFDFMNFDDKDFYDDEYFNNNSEISNEIANLSPEIKAIIIGDLLKRKEW